MRKELVAKLLQKRGTLVVDHSYYRLNKVGECRS